MSEPTVGPRGTFARVKAWVAGRERALLAAAAGFHVLVLAAMIALRLTPLLAGETVLVRVEPVDPRDMFRGDYVVLSYEFSRLPPDVEGLSADAYVRAHGGQTVYVALVPDADGVHWRAGKFSVLRPPSGPYLRGQIVSGGRVVYGIESYYVQEGKGREYERAVRDHRLSAEIVVSEDGEAVLRGLRIE